MSKKKLTIILELYFCEKILPFIVVKESNQNHIAYSKRLKNLQKIFYIDCKSYNFLLI